MDNSKAKTNDISVEALQKENKELHEQLEAARQKNNVQQEFISRMSHDIRSPLNAVIGFATLIREHSFNAQKVHSEAEKILKSSDYILGIVNDVLDMSKIESGSIALKNAPLDLEQCINDVEEIIISQVRSKYQKFTISIDGLKHKKVCTDENYLKQILLNLLTNSCKYTAEGGSIELLALDDELEKDGYLCVTFIVKDNGRGMSKEFQNNLFTPFGREQQSDVPDPGGTGLGLALIKNMITMMDGTIDCESELGNGTTFTVKIPMRLALEDQNTSNDSEASINEPDSKDVFRGLNILAAEDNELNSELLIEILSSKGAKITVEGDGRKVVDRFLSEPEKTYDLILMDVMMPRLNGYEAAMLIRDSKRSDAGSIPIIAMTANAFESDVQKALESGMNAHIAKPLNMTLLEKTVAKALQDIKS